MKEEWVLLSKKKKKSSGVYADEKKIKLHLK